MSPLEITDPTVVKAEVVEYIGSVLEDARVLSVTITDDVGADKAIALGSEIKKRMVWLKARRAAVYEPLKAATEGVRMEYDTPLKLGKAMEDTLAAAVITWKQKKRDEETRARLALEAKAKQEREEAARKEREAAAERDRIVREREAEEQRKRDAIAAEEKRKREAEEAEKREIAAKAQREADARAAQLKAEEDARIKNAQEAHDVGLAERSEQIIDKQMPVAPLPAPLPSAAELAEKAEEERKNREAAAMQEARKIAEKEAEDKKRDEEAAHLKRLDDEAAAARALAAQAEAEATQQVTVTRPEEKMRTSVNWRYDIPGVVELKKLCLAIAQDRAPVEYLGFHNKDGVYEAERLRSAFINKDLQRLKGEFQGEAIGIRTWPEESGSFKA